VSGFVSSGVAPPPPGRIDSRSQFPVEFELSTIAVSFGNQPPMKLRRSSRIRVFVFDTRSLTQTAWRPVCAIRRPSWDTLASVI
jgi:hypothetical protein